MHAIIMDMLKDNPNERISSTNVVSRTKFFAIQKNNLIELQLRIGRSVQLNIVNNRWELRNQIPIFDVTGDDALLFDSFLSAEDNQGTHSGANGVYDALLQVISEFDVTGIAEIFRLLLERRAAIPLFVPESKKHSLSLLRHITLPRVNNISLGDDKSLLRVAVISCRQMDQSQTCDILKSVFHIDSLHSLDLSKRTITSETMLAEIGCGCIVMEGSGTQIIQNVLVAHVIGDFRPLWSFLRRFADCFMIEDSTVESESFFSSFMTEEKKREIDSEDASIGVATNKSTSCIWKPSHGRPIIKQRVINGFTYFYIEDQLSGKSYKTIKSCIVECLKKTSEQPDFEKNRRELHKIPILEAERYSSLECVSPEDIEWIIGQSVQSLGFVKKNKFLLQKLFLQETKHVKVKMVNRLKEEIVRGEDEKIKAIRKRRRFYTRHVENNKLIQLFLSFLDSQDPCSRVLSIRVLEKELANRGEQEFGTLFKKAQMLSTSYYDKLHKTGDEQDLESAKEQLHDAKTDLESALNMEHLWRELSHLYTDAENRSPVIQKIPQLAAQHLLDGFCLELLDGDSNLIRQEWVNEVLFQLDKLVEGKRVFVLSVIGIQGSGKSTLLNTMFGIRMRTSVGQCTRGVNMQLLAVEGRPEYDYFLLLDTEGTRSPEYYGLAGSEKRDNQMATLSILPSDATIIVIPGENDAAVKEILPIVLMAYQGSQLAEENNGRLSSRIFFVYNRIDTKQKNKLDTIIHTLGTLLHEVFSQVQNMTGNSSNLKSESPFANFNLNSTDSSPSDVCILGNVNKQTKPPGDVPDEEYEVELVQFREHIHQRVTKVEDGKVWKSRSIGDFSKYIKNVWKCICSANLSSLLSL
jgi:hypothetical protein